MEMMKKTVRGRERIAKLSEEEITVRKGPWTMEEDLILFNYIINHGEGLWNSVAKASGLKRTGKSCRLRWLNYLRPDVRRGNITAEEQLLIMQLHAKLGNRWSKIAKHLPGRTDNEIKNFWRTKIQKHIKVSSSSSSSENLIMNHSQSSEMMTMTMTTGDQGSSSKHFDMVVEAETFSPATTTTTTTSTFHELDHSHDNYWNVDDLWPLQFA